MDFNRQENHHNCISFCTLTFPRSGSTWFMSLLQSHPQIGVYGEIFLDRTPQAGWHHQAFLPTERFCQFKDADHRIRPWSIFQYLDTFTAEHSQEYAVLGFKIMYQQLLGKPEIILKMISDHYKVIHLVRKNHLDVMISSLISRKRGKAHSREEIDPPTVYLDPSSLVMKLKMRKYMIKLIRLILRVLPLSVHEITYEALCNNKEKSLTTIARFLSVDPYMDYESPFKKISRKPDWKRIENYKEIKEALRNTAFIDLLDTR